EVVVRNDFRLPEILHLAGGLEARAPRGRFQRSQLDPAPAQGEVGFRGPGKGTISTERTVRLPQQNVSFIDAAKQRITHIARHIAQGKIQRHSLVSPDQFATAYFKAADGQRKKL